MHLQKVIGQLEEQLPQDTGKRNKVHFRLDDATHQALRMYVIQHGLSIQSLMEDLIKRTVQAPLS